MRYFWILRQFKKTHQIIVTLVLFFLLVGTSVAAPVVGPIDGPERTQEFIAYLDFLLLKRAISTRELEVFSENLKKGKLVNPIPKEIEAEQVQFDSLNSNLSRQYLQAYIDLAQIDIQEVLVWAHAQLEGRKQIINEQEVVRAETQLLEKKMVFNRIEPGKFRMAIEENYRWFHRIGVPVRLTRPFEMSSTLVKQWHWALIMGKNKSKFSPGSLRSSLFPNDKEFRFIPFDSSIKYGNEIEYEVDHFVNNMTWNSIQKFISRLNTLSNQNHPLLSLILEDFQPGDQFRLPTEAEWSFVIQDRGRVKKMEVCGEMPEKFRNWTVDGKIFYDFDLDASELLGDRFVRAEMTWVLPPKIRPQPLNSSVSGFERPFTHLVRRASKSKNFFMLKSCRYAQNDDGDSTDQRNSFSPRSNFLPLNAFRLVRIRKGN